MSIEPKQDRVISTKVITRVDTFRMLTLLSRMSRSICAIAMIFYFVLMLPALQDNMERYVQLNADVTESISYRARVIIGGITGIYIGAALWNISRFFTLKKLGSTSVHGMTRLNVLVASIAAASSLFTTAFDFGGMKDDYFGYL